MRAGIGEEHTTVSGDRQVVRRQESLVREIGDGTVTAGELQPRSGAAERGSLGVEAEGDEVDPAVLRHQHRPVDREGGAVRAPARLREQLHRAGATSIRYSAPSATLVTTSRSSPHQTGPSPNRMSSATTSHCIASPRVRRCPQYLPTAVTALASRVHRRPGSRTMGATHGTTRGGARGAGTAMTIRVVQWATGAVGIAQLREIVDRPDLELVGLFAYDPAKVGVDAGTLVDRPPTGVTATNDKSAILALDADLVLHAASKAFAENTNTDDIVALLASGKSVITTTSYSHLPTYGSDADQRIRQACERGGPGSTPPANTPGSCSSASRPRSPRSRNGSTRSPCRSSSTAPECPARRCWST